MLKNRFKKPFWVTLFWHQIKWHRHGTFIHTLKVAYHVAKVGRWDLVPAALLHDIGKPITAYHDADDIAGGCVDYSFTLHEEIGYRLIEKLPEWLVSDYTKNVVRYHYHIRGMHKARKKGNTGRYNRMKRDWVGFDDNFKKDLALFLKADDLAKK